MKATVLESGVHQQVVVKHNQMVGGVRKSLRETPWVTPLTLAPDVELPTLDQLLDKTAWQVGSNGTVHQYISPHPKWMPRPAAARASGEQPTEAMAALALSSDDVLEAPGAAPPTG